MLDSLSGVKYLLGQLERGEEGTLHFQGYVQWESPISLATCKARTVPSIHWEIRKGSHDQAVAYVTKEDTREPGSDRYERGQAADNQGRRTDLEGIRQMVQDGESLFAIWEEHFGSMLRYSRGVREYQLLCTQQRNWTTFVIVRYGPPGCGKSRQAYELGGNDAYWKPNGKWFDGYDGQKRVVIDDFYGWLPYNQLLNLCDRYPLNVETKGGTASFVADWMCFTTNSDPISWYSPNGHIYPQAIMRRIDCMVIYGEDGNLDLDRSWYRGPHDEEITFVANGPPDFEELHHKTLCPESDEWDVETASLPDDSSPIPPGFILETDDEADANDNSGNYR
jgi:hypothetical protein